jgi:hypothetical protein
MIETRTQPLSEDEKAPLRSDPSAFRFRLSDLPAAIVVGLIAGTLLFFFGTKMAGEGPLRPLVNQWAFISGFTAGALACIAEMRFGASRRRAAEEAKLGADYEVMTISSEEWLAYDLDHSGVSHYLVQVDPNRLLFFGIMGVKMAREGSQLPTKTFRGWHRPGSEERDEPYFVRIEVLGSRLQPLKTFDGDWKLPDWAEDSDKETIGEGRIGDYMAG